TVSGLPRALRSRTSTVFFDETGGGGGAGGGGTTNLTETSSLRLSSGRVDIHISAVSPAACRRIETIAPVPILLLGALERLRMASNMSVLRPASSSNSATSASRYRSCLIAKRQARLGEQYILVNGDLTRWTPRPCASPLQACRHQSGNGTFAVTCGWFVPR